MKLLGSTTNSIDKDKDSDLVLKLESVDLVLVHCNLVNNSYQQASKVLFTFVPDKKVRPVNYRITSFVDNVKNGQY